MQRLHNSKYLNGILGESGTGSLAACSRVEGEMLRMFDVRKKLMIWKRLNHK